MVEFLADYGLFLAKLMTVAVIVLVVVGFIVATAKRGAQQGGLDVENLNKRFENLGDAVRRVVHGKEQFKKDSKGRRKDEKKLAKKGSQ